ncbi:MAG: 50S ribosomal protein L17 [Deltaproteobacteria bacterium]|nr:50S ribosomal protein L17 [Deltaproteobacteria bacterium]
MRHLKKGRKLNRSVSHRKALFRNMATSLFRHERIETTDAKAKELRGYAEKLITLAKRDDVHSRRLAFQKIRDTDVLKKLFDDIAPRFKGRPGGYTRVTKVRVRRGDNATMSLIELVGSEPSASAAGDED